MLHKDSKLNLGIVILIIALGFACYSNTLNGPFLLDDYHNILHNGYVRISHFTLSALFDAAFKSPIHTRPVANLSFALNHLAHGMWLPGYHLTNIAIHCLAAILLFFFIQGTLATPACQPRLSPTQATTVAGLSALFWLVNPANTQSISYIVQRMNSLAAMFYILSMLLYLKGRTAARHQPGYFTGCLLSGLLALGTKEISATLPLLIFLYEWYFLQDLDRGWLKKKLPLLGVAAVFVGIIAWLYLGRDFSSLLSGYQSRDFTLGQRLLTEPRVIWRYFALIFVPYPGLLNLDHDFPLSTAPLQPASTIIAIIGLAGLILAAIRTAPRQRLLSFSILWFLLNLVIESSILPLEIIFDHRAYLPIMLGWPALLLAGVGKFPERHKPFTLIAAIALLLVFSTWTLQRNKVWADEISMYRDVVAKSPNKARAHSNLGRTLIYYSFDTEEEGRRELERAIELDRNYGYAYLSLGGYYLQNYRYPEAIANFQTVIRLMPGFKEVYYHLAMTYYEDKQFPEAIAAANIAATLPYYRKDALSYLGLASIETGDTATAGACFRELSQDYPEESQFRYNFGRALERAGQKRAALQKYSEALPLATDADRGIIQQSIANLQSNLGN